MPRNPKATGLGYLPKGGVHKALELRAAAVSVPHPAVSVPDPTDCPVAARQRGGRLFAGAVVLLVGSASVVSGVLVWVIR